MKKLFLLCLTGLIISNSSFARILRVGFFGPPVIGVDYFTLQAAHNAANPGDTVMMMPASKMSANISKRLVVIGPGYFLTQNTGLQANSATVDSTVNLGGMNITDAAASGSIFMGCIFTNSGINISGANVANILFSRCWFNNTPGNLPCIQLSQNITNFIFQQCAFKGRGITNQELFTATNISFVNCMFYTIDNSGDNIIGINLAGNLPHSGLIQNCIFSQGTNSSLHGNLNGTWAINNCIANTGNNFLAGAGINYQNNLGTGTQFPAGNGNQQNIPWANIFTLTGSTDNRYTLKAGSPAFGAGVNGVDAGIFGGATPYKLSGIPRIPTIYALTSPEGNTPTVNTIQINISTRSNN